MKDIVLSNVLLVPPFDSFFDGDIQRLPGFDIFSDYMYVSPLKDDTTKFKVAADLKIEHWLEKKFVGPVKVELLPCYMYVERIPS